MSRHIRITRLQPAHFEYIWAMMAAKFYSIGLLQEWKLKGFDLGGLREMCRLTWVEGRKSRQVSFVRGSCGVIPVHEAQIQLIFLPAIEGDGGEIAQMLHSFMVDFNDEITHWVEEFFRATPCEHCRRAIGTVDPLLVAVRSPVLPDVVQHQYAHVACINAVLRRREPSEAELGVSWTVASEHPSHKPLSP